VAHLQPLQHLQGQTLLYCRLSSANLSLSLRANQRPLPVPKLQHLMLQRCRLIYQLSRTKQHSSSRSAASWRRSWISCSVRQHQARHLLRQTQEQLSSLETRLATASTQLTAAKNEVNNIKMAAAKQLAQLSDALTAAQSAAKQAQADMEKAESRGGQARTEMAASAAAATKLQAEIAVLRRQVGAKHHGTGCLRLATSASCLLSGYDM